MDCGKDPAHSASRGQQSDLIADLQVKVTQPADLECTCEGDAAIHYQQVVLVRTQPRHFDPQRAVSRLRVVTVDGEGTCRMAGADESAVQELAAEKALSTEQSASTD